MKAQDFERTIAEVNRKIQNEITALDLRGVEERHDPERITAIASLVSSLADLIGAVDNLEKN